jgi:hypothetical protein
MRIHSAIAGAAFILTIVASSGAYAFETTSIGGTNADGSAQFQDPDEQALKGPLGGVQFSAGTNGNTSDDSTTPPWQIKPPPASTGCFDSPMSGMRTFQSGR